MWPSFDIQRYPYAMPDLYGVSYRHASPNPCPYINPDADVDANGNGNRNPGRNPHANTDINTDRNPDVYSHTYP